MSEENKGVSDAPANKEVPKSDQVSKKAYEDVTKDMHKYKAKLKEAELARAEYEAQLSALEEAKMRENDQWKELSEKYKAEAEEARVARLNDRSAYIDTVKKTALKNELGGSINDTYLVHANLDEIEVNENGTIDKDSLLSVANAFRQEHGVLLSNTTGSNATSSAPALNKTMSTSQKSVSEMTYEEKALLLKSMKENRS